MQENDNMKISAILFSVISLLWLKFTHAKIGYFWHITDLHYDPFHNSQDFAKGCRHNGGEHSQRNRHRPERVCDSSWSLIESAAALMKDRHPDTLEFVLWTGDILSSSLMKNYSDEFRLAAVQNVTDLLSRTFSSQFVFPALGHNDLPPSKQLTDMWMQWLPSDALQTFVTGGYYTIEQTYSKLRIVTLNSVLWSGAPGVRHSDAQLQFDWLEKVLNKAQNNKEMVYLVAHTGPGMEERSGYGSNHGGELTSPANGRLLLLTRKFSGIIAGQFYGHRHADTFRIVYDNREKPVSWMFLAPAVTPRGHGTATNPGLRLYKFDSSNGKVLDYTQYYLDVSSPRHEAHWSIEYNLTRYYNLPEVSALSLHALAKRLPQENTLFAKYIMARTVRHSGPDGSFECDTACVHAHYCAITRADYFEYHACVRSPASALASLATANLNVRMTAVIVFIAILTLLGRLKMKL